MGMYVQYRKKNTVYIGFDTVCGFKHSLGVLEHVPHRYVGTTVKGYISHFCS